jgi:hypothetical protein
MRERAKRVAPVLAAEAGRPRLTALKLSPYAASSHDRVTAALGVRYVGQQSCAFPILGETEVVDPHAA